jgi:hypothetical protein
VDFNPEDYIGKEMKTLTMTNEEGFCLDFEQLEGMDEVRIFQRLYGETVYVMTMDRHKVADLIYKLEDFLE